MHHAVKTVTMLILSCLLRRANFDMLSGFNSDLDENDDDDGGGDIAGASSGQDCGIMVEQQDTDVGQLSLSDCQTNDGDIQQQSSTPVCLSLLLAVFVFIGRTGSDRPIWPVIGRSPVRLTSVFYQPPNMPPTVPPRSQMIPC